MAVPVAAPVAPAPKAIVYPALPGPQAFPLSLPMAVGSELAGACALPPAPLPSAPPERTPTLTRLTASCACIILMFLEGFRSESSWVDPR